MHPVLPRGRVAPAIVHARAQVALHDLADLDVLLLDLVAEREELRPRRIHRRVDRRMFGVPLEHHAAAIVAEREDDVRLHLPEVDVEHHVREKPRVHRFGRFRRRWVVLPVAAPRVEWAQRRVLDGEEPARLDDVVVVVELLVQPRVHHGDVIALEVVVDVDLPVAGDLPLLAHHVAHRLAAKGREARGQIFEDFGERRRLAVHVHEDERPPRRHLHRHEAHRLRVEALHSLHLGRAAQCAVEGVGPAVVAALQRVASPAPRRDGTRAMQTHIVEAAQRLAVA